MGRPVARPGGDYLPELAEGIRRRHAYMERSFPGIGNRRLESLNRGERFAISAVDVWSALWAVDPELARLFGREHGGPRGWDDELWFVFDPAAQTLAPMAPDPNHQGETT